MQLTRSWPVSPRCILLLLSPWWSPSSGLSLVSTGTKPANAHSDSHCSWNLSFWSQEPGAPRPRPHRAQNQPGGSRREERTPNPHALVAVKLGPCKCWLCKHFYTSPWDSPAWCCRFGGFLELSNSLKLMINLSSINGLPWPSIPPGF